MVLVLLAALLAFQVLRTAAVHISADTMGAKLWPGHPTVMLNHSMSTIGGLAGRGETLPPALMARLDEIARKMPLATEPFLIKGAVAQMQGRDRLAERLYLEARSRDPRSRAARYFLAERLLATGRVAPALGEMAALSRLSAASGVFAPALADYARTPGAVPQLRRFFQFSPELEPAVLSHLAADSRNLDLILNLWSGRDAQPGLAPPEWLNRIIAALFDKGEFGKAYSVWRRFSGVEAGSRGIFNSKFQTPAAPPPFNWTYGTVGGVAEPAGDGRLQVIYYGRQDTVLVEQILLLAPDRYQLSMNLAGNLREAAGIIWSLKCLPQDEPIMSKPIQQRHSSARVDARFTVPHGCPVQRLQLAAEASEYPKTSEFTISNLRLTKATSR